MTTVMMPPEGELLRAVREGVEAEPEPVRTWPQRSFQLCLDLLRRIRESAGEARQALAEELAAGVEARSFARTYGEFLPAADEFVTMVQELREFLSPLEDPPSQRLGGGGTLTGAGESSSPRSSGQGVVTGIGAMPADRLGGCPYG